MTLEFERAEAVERAVGVRARVMQTWRQQLDEARRIYPVGAVHVTTEVGRSHDRVVGHAWRRGVGVIVLMEQVEYRYRHWMRLDSLARCERVSA